jgi:transposase
VILSSTPNLEEASMWTAANRKSYERQGLRYPSDMTEAEWALVKPLVDVPQRGQGRRRVVDLREVLNAIFYILATGCQWRALPRDLPPRSTVHDYFIRWQCDRTLMKLHHELYVQAREQAGKEASPTTAIVDSQSVKSAERGVKLRIRSVTMPARRSRGASATRSSIRSV